MTETQTITTEITCPYCNGKGISKYGSYKGVQRYWCKACKHKQSTGGIYAKQTEGGTLISRRHLRGARRIA